MITTAAVPGKKAPILITGEMAARMAPGSVIVDIAAERGGNCELTRAGETVDASGVSIIGPANLPSTALSCQPDVREEHHHVSENLIRDGRRRSTARTRSCAKHWLHSEVRSCTR